MTSLGGGGTRELILIRGINPPLRLEKVMVDRDKIVSREVGKLHLLV